ncbi:hypothetical protein BC833DRAFT_573511 [Globomyces pollinis-pini]|nr:hypothetical protein BC833DRAFT_573511 [Globomyces pollinis-pini]
MRFPPRFEGRPLQRPFLPGRDERGRSVEEDAELSLENGEITEQRADSRDERRPERRPPPFYDDRRMYDDRMRYREPFRPDPRYGYPRRDFYDRPYPPYPYDRPRYDRTYPPARYDDRRGFASPRGSPSPEFDRRPPRDFDRRSRSPIPLRDLDPPPRDYDRRSRSPPYSGSSFGRRSPGPRDLDRLSPPPRRDRIVNTREFDRRSPNPREFDRRSPIPREFDRRSPIPRDFDRRSPNPRDFDRRSPIPRDGYSNFDRRSPIPRDSHFDRRSPIKRGFDSISPAPLDYDHRHPLPRDIRRSSSPEDYHRSPPPPHPQERRHHYHPGYENRRFIPPSDRRPPPSESVRMREISLTTDFAHTPTNNNDIYPPSAEKKVPFARYASPLRNTDPKRQADIAKPVTQTPVVPKKIELEPLDPITIELTRLTQEELRHR